MLDKGEIMFERNADVLKPAVMMVAHNSRGSPTLPCAKSYKKETVDEVQDSTAALATTVATTPNMGEDVLVAPQSILTLTLAAPVTKECLSPSTVKE